MIQGDTLKPGWKLVKFGDVVSQVKDKIDPKTSGLERYIAGEHMNTDDLQIHRWGEINDNYLGPAFNMHFKPGQVLYGSRRTYLRKVAVPAFEGICANTTFVLEPKDLNVLLPELLPLIMHTEAFHEHSIKQSKGSVNPYVNFTDLEWWKFPLPPIEEQRKIVQLCTAHNTYNDELQVAIIKALQVEIAWLKSIIERYKNLSYAKVPLDKVLEKPPESGVSAPPQATETGHWVLALNALTEMGYLPEQLKPVEPTETMLSALLYRDDLLISRSNTSERVGFVGIYNGEQEGFVSFPDTMMRLRCRSDIVLSEYLELYLQSSTARHQITRIAAGTSASMKKINKTNLQNLSVIIPPLDEQRQVIINRKQIASGRLAIVERRRQSRSQYFRFLNHAISAN